MSVLSKQIFTLYKLKTFHFTIKIIFICQTAVFSFCTVSVTQSVNNEAIECFVCSEGLFKPDQSH